MSEVSGESAEPSAPAPLEVFAPDPVLAASEDIARAALRGLTADSNVGAMIGVVPLAEHVLNLQFECKLSAYPHWLWTVTLSRIDDESAPTVLESELLPGEGALLSPAWIPWSERRLEIGDDADGDFDDDDVDIDDLEEEDELHGVDDLDEEIDAIAGLDPDLDLDNESEDDESEDNDR